MRHVALLRGINVGGKNLVPMKRLVAMFEEHGATEVVSYIQSGNVVFTAAAALAKAIPDRISAALAKELKLTVPVVVRSAKELDVVVKGNPFVARGVDADWLHVVFLRDRPAKAQVALLDPSRSPGDELEVVGSEVYLHLPNGAGRSKLTNAWFDSKLKTISTARNWRTVQKLRELAHS